jgi:hypothetical protein
VFDRLTQLIRSLTLMTAIKNLGRHTNDDFNCGLLPALTEMRCCFPNLTYYLKNMFASYPAMLSVRFPLLDWGRSCRVGCAAAVLVGR